MQKQNVIILLRFYLSCEISDYAQRTHVIYCINFKTFRYKYLEFIVSKYLNITILKNILIKFIIIEIALSS